jgi:hypothetical protein
MFVCVFFKIMREKNECNTSKIKVKKKRRRENYFAISKLFSVFKARERDLLCRQRHLPNSELETSFCLFLILHIGQHAQSESVSISAPHEIVCNDDEEEDDDEVDDDEDDDGEVFFV